MPHATPLIASMVAITGIVRAHSQEEVAHLARHGADSTIMSEREIAARMTDRALIGA